jgi:hypothetical protein
MIGMFLLDGLFSVELVFHRAARPAPPSSLILGVSIGALLVAGIGLATRAYLGPHSRSR